MFFGARFPKALVTAFLLSLCAFAASAQVPDQDTVIRGIDAAVKARIDRVASYSVNEHYAIYRGNDVSNPAAEMLIRTDYKKDHGKNFTILSQSGSSILRNQLMGTVLDSEKQMSQPGTRETVLVNSSNYQMTLKSTAPKMLDGRACLLLEIKPRRSSPSLFNGTLWVDAKDYNIVQLVGTASKSHSMLTGAAQVSRQYAPISGYSMATHALAISKSALLGVTTIKIDYSGYLVQLLP